MNTETIHSAIEQISMGEAKIDNLKKGLVEVADGITLGELASNAHINREIKSIRTNTVIPAIMVLYSHLPLNTDVVVNHAGIKSITLTGYTSVKFTR